jgi:phage terminase small subunit
MADSTLTTKQQEFIAAYLGEAHGNATEAARMAGYAHPGQEGHRLLKNAEIAARVKAVVDEHGMTAQEVLHELATLAKADWKDFVRVTGRAKDGEATAVQSDISSKVKALELLGKYHQLFNDRIDLNVTVREHRVIGIPQNEIEAIFRPAPPRELTG